MYVDVALVAAVRDDALLVPKRALVFDQDQIFVFRLEGGDRVERVVVLPEIEDKNWVSPRGGLAEGDRLVVAGQAGLKEGARVRLAGQKAEEEKIEEDSTGADSQEATAAREVE
jgi:membrane fusion protein (multidrug efflux system)